MCHSPPVLTEAVTFPMMKQYRWMDTPRHLNHHIYAKRLWYSTAHILSLVWSHETELAVYVADTSKLVSA